MDQLGLDVVDTLCLKYPELFEHYFKEVSEERSEQHEEAEERYLEVGYPLDFNRFLVRYRQHRGKGPRTRIVREVQTAPAVEPVYARQVSPSISVVPPFRKRRQRPAKETLNVADFLSRKKQNEDVFALKFRPDEDVQEALAERGERAPYKRVRIQGQMRQIAKEVELWNDHSPHPLLVVFYDA